LNELQLVGYTADLQNLVLSDAAGASRFRVPLDDDFLATVEEVVGLARPDLTFSVSAQAPEPEPAPAPQPAPAPEPLEPPGPRPGEGALAASGLLAQRKAADDDSEAAQQRGSRLSPREIQALLRAGKTTRAVAKLAGTEESLILRWLPPIEAERDQVLQAVWRQRLSKARLGASRDQVGEAVRRNLAAKGVRPDDDEVRWSVARRNGDDLWTVELRYRSRGKAQRALWRYDTESKTLEARNDLAAEIAWTRPRRGKDVSAQEQAGTAQATPEDSAEQAAEVSAAESSGERSTAKKPPSGRGATNRSAAKKRGGKKRAATKSAAKKSAAKKSAAKKSAAKKSAAKKSAAKKSAAKKSTAKKPAAPRSAASPRKVVAKKALIRRPRPGGAA
jgi:hypothetical protein